MESSGVATRVAKSRGVIVYLAQARHSSYGRDSISLLRMSVASLFRYYNSRAGDDVIFFHTGLERMEQHSVLRLCTGARARFLRVPARHFTAPRGLPPAKQWLQPRFSEGYRHMIRLFTVGLWQIVADEGYEFVMRMDEDSFLWSPIHYNIFQFMASNGLEYGYRLAAWEHGVHGITGESFFSFVKSYLIANNISPGWLLDSCPVGMRQAANFSLRLCGSPYGVYNNFFVTRVGFWFRSDVQHFLNHIDGSGTIYTMRWGDLLWHSTAIKLFMDRRRVHMFRDFAYEHASFGKLGEPAASRRRNVTSSGSALHLQNLCWGFGAIALPTTGQGIPNADLNAARQRLRVLASMPLCRWHGKFIERPCAHTARSPDHRLQVHGLSIGSVSPAQPSCSRIPPPYYCDNLSLPVRSVERRQQFDCACYAGIPYGRRGPQLSRFWKCYTDLFNQTFLGGRRSKPNGHKV